jgi:hypothetical protein
VSVGGIGGIRLHVEHCIGWQDGFGLASENLNTNAGVSKVAVHAANSLVGFKTSISIVVQGLMAVFAWRHVVASSENGIIR